MINKVSKVVILAGGFGSRLSEYTNLIPKPMVKIGNKPILIHIMKLYLNFGYRDFYILMGYKSSVIKKYFKNFKSKWKINLIETGLDTMTGGRVKRMKKYLKNETFMLTYGDGLSNININKLVKFHKKQKKIITISAVRPPARFGSLKLKGSKVLNFREKSQLDESWINGGFFVIEPSFFKMIKGDSTILEKEPLERAVKEKKICAYKHNAFWQCMDHKLDKDLLDELVKKRKAPWLI